MNSNSLSKALLITLASFIVIQNSDAQEFVISVTPSNSEFQPVIVDGNWHVVQTGSSFASSYTLPDNNSSEPTKTILTDSTYYQETTTTEYALIGFRIGDGNQNYSNEQLQDILVATQESRVSVSAVCNETTSTWRTNYLYDAAVGDPTIVNTASRKISSSNTIVLYLYQTPVFTTTMPISDSKVVWSSTETVTFSYFTSGGGNWSGNLFYQINGGSRHNASNGTLSVPLTCDSGSSSIVVTMENIRCIAPDGVTDWTPQNAKERRTANFTVWSIPKASRENAIEEYTYVFNGRTLTLAPSIANGDDEAWTFYWKTNSGEEATDTNTIDISTTNGRLKEAVSGRTSTTVVFTAVNNPVGIDAPKTVTVRYNIYTMPEPIVDIQENGLIGYSGSQFNLSLTVTDSDPAYYPTNPGQQNTPTCYYIWNGKQYHFSTTSTSANGSITYSATVTPTITEGTEIITVYWSRQLRHTEGYYHEPCQLFEYNKNIELAVYSRGALDKSENHNITIYGDATPCYDKVWNEKVLSPSVVGGYDAGWTFIWKEISDPANVIVLSDQTGNLTSKDISITANNNSGKEQLATLRVIASNAISPSLKGNTDSVDYQIRIFPKATTNVNFVNNKLVNRYYGESETLSVSNDGGSSNWNFYWMTSNVSNNLDNSDGNINGVKSYKSSTKSASDTEPDQTVTRTLKANNFSPDGKELWYEQLYEYPIHLWSKGKVTKDSNYNEHLYGGTHNNETRIRANVQGGFKEGNIVSYLVLEGSNYVKLTEIAKNDSIVCLVTATNHSGQDQIAKIRVNWSNVIDSDHKGNSDSFEYVLHVSPGASQIPEPLVGWTNNDESSPEIVRDVDFKELSLTPGIGGNQWVYEWYVDDQLIDRGANFGKYLELSDSSDKMNVTTKAVTVHWYNITSSGIVVEEGTTTQYLKIYNTPKAPYALEKKGNSNIYIAYVDDMSDQQLFSDEYAYTFQFGDGSTTSGLEEESSQRWHQYSNSPSNPWVRTCWHYSDYDCYSNAIDIHGVTRSLSSIEEISNNINNCYLILSLKGNIIKRSSTNDVTQLDLRSGVYIIKDCRNGQFRKISIK